MDEKVILRRMLEEDAKEAALIEEACFTTPWAEEVYRQTLKLPYSLYFAAEADGKLIGTCGLQNIAGEGEISNVAVLPTWRGRGIASDLLQMAITEGEKEGITDFTLEVREGNTAARALYDSFGFVIEGRRKAFYRDPVEDALIMWRRSN